MRRLGSVPAGADPFFGGSGGEQCISEKSPSRSNSLFQYFIFRGRFIPLQIFSVQVFFFLGFFFGWPPIGHVYNPNSLLLYSDHAFFMVSGISPE